MRIDYYGEPGLNVYAILRLADGTVFNPATLSNDSVTPVNNSVYGIALVESSSYSGAYSADVSAGTPTTYVCEYWRRVGASPDRAADTRLGAVEFFFDSTYEWPAESLSTISGSTTTINNNGSGGDGFNEQDRNKLRELYNLRTRTKI
jgi:hypothetical protein